MISPPGDTLAAVRAAVFACVDPVAQTTEFRAVLEAAGDAARAAFDRMRAQFGTRLGAKLKGELRVGGLQQFAADLGDAVVYCANDELGYARTFDAVARALTTGLRLDGKPMEPGYFGEINVISIDGQQVGVAST